MNEQTEHKSPHRRCGTCHYACDCREALFEDRRVILERELAEMTEQRDAAMATVRLQRENHKRELDEMTAERNSARYALMLAARWGISCDVYSPEIASTIRCWVISGMTGNSPTNPIHHTKPTETK